VLYSASKLAFLFTSIELAITLVIETYRVHVSEVYGVPVLAVPILGMSFLVVIRWLILQPFILYLARRHMLGYPDQSVCYANECCIRQMVDERCSSRLDAVSDQWEYAHAINAFIKIMGLSSLVLSVLVETPKQREIHSDSHSEMLRQQE
jgi:hypothetical protein